MTFDENSDTSQLLIAAIVQDGRLNNSAKLFPNVPDMMSLLNNFELGHFFTFSLFLFSLFGQKIYLLYKYIILDCIRSNLQVDKAEPPHSLPSLPVR